MKSGREQYDTYLLSARERIIYLLLFESGILLVGQCFYDSWIAGLLLSPSVIILMKHWKGYLAQKRKHRLKLEFKDALQSVAAAQKAAFSVENSFLEARKDMEMLHGKNSLICKELEWICHGIKNNIPLEESLMDLGVRSGCEEIRQFGEVFLISKRRGGNLTDLIRLCADVIEGKEETELEISVLIQAKKTEAAIMCAVPFLIICYLNAVSPGFFDSLYHNPVGIVIMTGCLGVYVSAICLAIKITNIRV